MDTQRVERKSRADQAGFETSLAELARVPMGDGAREVLSFAQSGNALIAACRMVADAAGIALREPPVSTGDRTDALEEIARRPGFVCVLSRYWTVGGIATTVRCLRSWPKPGSPSL